MELTFTDSQLNLKLLLPRIRIVRLIGATVCCELPVVLFITRSTRLQ